MSLKNSLFMAGILALVMLFIFRYEIPRGERVERESFVMHKASEEQIARIAFNGEKGSFTLQRTPQGKQSWGIEQLPEAIVDPSLVNGVVSGLQGFKSDSVVPANEQSSDLSVYGLAKPALTLEVGGAEKTTINFGKRNEFLGKRYARVVNAQNQAALMLTDETLFLAANRPRDDFREKNPVQFADNDIKEISVELNGKKMVFVQDGSKWSLEEPVQADADPDAVLNLVREVRGLKVAEFIDQPAAGDPYQFASAAKLNFSFTEADRAPISIAVTASGEKGKESLYFNLGGTTVYKAVENSLAKIIKPMKDFRVKRFFQFDVEQAKKLEVNPGATVIESDGVLWKVNSAEGDTVFVLQYLNDLSFVEAVDFPVDIKGDFGFDKPSRQFKLTLKDKDGAESVKELLIGGATNVPSGGKGFYAVDAAHRELPVILSEAMVQKLTPKPEALKKSVATPAPLLTTK